MIAKICPIVLIMALAGCGAANEEPAAAAATAASIAQQSRTSASSSASSSSNSAGTSISAATQTGSGNSASASSSTSSSNGALSTSEETNDYEFEYSWPGEAGRDPALAKILQSQLDDARREIQMQSAEARAQSANDDFPFRKHSLGVTWQVVADMPAFLSLSSAIASYGGGAHGNLGFDVLVWDKNAKLVMAASDFFTSPAAMSAALKSPYCKALNAQRAKKRGFSAKAGSTDQFDKCPRMDELDILLGSSNGETFNRVGLLAAPYVAGPYAEGDYEVTLNVDAKVIAAVKPEYRQFFSAGK